jgi:predicted lipoprotein with Yx(FWY)xxD motif
VNGPTDKHVIHHVTWSPRSIATDKGGTSIGPLHPKIRKSHGGLAAMAVGIAAALLLTSCGSGTSPPATTASGTAASIFSAMNVSGLGQVLVDGNERTVYVLTSGTHQNVPCTSTSGCTNVWPSLPLTSATSASKAGSGIQSAMLGKRELSDGKTYPTYAGWLMYEYSGDSGPDQAGGEGISSFGGTWYVLSPSGTPITARTTNSSGGSAY